MLNFLSRGVETVAFTTNFLTLNCQFLGIPGDSDWYSRPYIFFILRKKYSIPYTGGTKVSNIGCNFLI
jgi:hypothetical protein